jgi:hypothetical protein
MQDGLSAAKTHRDKAREELMGFAALNPSYDSEFALSLVNTRSILPCGTAPRDLAGNPSPHHPLADPGEKPPGSGGKR